MVGIGTAGVFYIDNLPGHRNHQQWASELQSGKVDLRRAATIAFLLGEEVAKGSRMRHCVKYCVIGLTGMRTKTGLVKDGHGKAVFKSDGG